ncbi:uncharacterized protein E5676_scaffold98G001260 [Cucumis melo var. makuwa]|uniref:Uncharacterized protein n=1 Tax=Cucumis melo var. makuwa TaxID=1194695 RepID=A0A5D3C143_CUCMM|nr:uncharacterized protein E5676_scaffold98G001260 [Cucumis melo var. makuwa]
MLQKKFVHRFKLPAKVADHRPKNLSLHNLSALFYHCFIIPQRKGETSKRHSSSHSNPSEKKRKAEFVSQFSVSSEEFDQFEKSDETEKQRSKEPIEVDLNALF